MWRISSRGNQYGEIKTNQDAYIVKTTIWVIPGFNLFGVLDGHFASNFAKDFILKEITNYTNSMKINGVETAEDLYQLLKLDNFNTTNTNIYKNTDKEMAKQLFYYELSVTTFNIVFQFADHLL